MLRILWLFFLGHFIVILIPWIIIVLLGYRFGFLVYSLKWLLRHRRFNLFLLILDHGKIDPLKKISHIEVSHILLFNYHFLLFFLDRILIFSHLNFWICSLLLFKVSLNLLLAKFLILKILLFEWSYIEALSMTFNFNFILIVLWILSLKDEILNRYASMIINVKENYTILFILIGRYRPRSNLFNHFSSIV